MLMAALATDQKLNPSFVSGRTWFLKKSLKSGKVSIHYACVD